MQPNKVIKAMLATACIAVAQPVSAQSIPGADSFGGIGSLFGGGGKATLELQVIQQAELALQTAEQIKHTESWLIQLQQMPGSSVAGVLGDIGALLRELARMEESFGEIYDDPTPYGTHEASIQYRQRQLERQLDRLDEMKATTETINRKVQDVSGSADELAALNKAAEGGTAAQQIGNEAALLQLDLERQQILLQQEGWRATAQQEARRAEDEALAEARNCEFWGPDFYQSGTCQ